MKTFEEVVNDITKEYCQELTEKGLRKVFEQLPPGLRWRGVYYGWNDWNVWQELCGEVHKYMESY